MKLSELLNCNYDTLVKGIKTDSRKVEEGDLFVCLKGEVTDGHKYIDMAIKKGAAAILLEEDIECSIPTIKVESTKEILPIILRKFYGNFNEKLKFIGVTGTSGKTSASTIIYEFLKKFIESSYIGSNGVISRNYNEQQVANTTPNECELYNILRRLSENNVEYVAMELSSAGLKQDRLGDIELDFGIFTNLTIDHLDYHKTFEDYKMSKLKMFERIKKDGYAILSMDDKHFAEFKLHCNCHIMTYGRNKDADIQIIDINPRLENTLCTIKYNNKEYFIETNLNGEFNIYNICAALGVAITLGISLEDCIKAAKSLIIAGRMERLEYGQNFSIILDLCNKKDSIKDKLVSLNRIKKRRIITVASCTNNDLDVVKGIGQVCTLLSDYTIFTTSKDSDKKEEDIANKLSLMTQNVQSGNFEVTFDRESAIKKALLMAKEDDIVLVTGSEYLFGSHKNVVNPYKVCEDVIKELLESPKTEDDLLNELIRLYFEDNLEEIKRRKEEFAPLLEKIDSKLRR